MTNVTNADFSLLLWMLGVLVFGLGLHLSNGWIRMAERGSSLRSQWRALLLASAALGTGIDAALVLSMQAQPLNFPIGYRWWAALALWAAAVLACLPTVMLSVRGRQGWRLMSAGTLLALAALALEAGWIWAAGFRPGVTWRNEVVVGAGIVLIIGMGLARWMGFSAACEASPRSALWRLGSVGLSALVLMGAQEMMNIGAGIIDQRGSLYQGEIPGTLLSLVSGVLVPLLMSAMALDLWLRRQQRRSRGSQGFNPKPRRKRRHRIRTL